MLKHLYVKNFTLIEELDIDFYSGFSVITGETGAGKSIILGAIHLLLGQRADTKQIKLGQEKCIVEATFDISNYGMEEIFAENNIDYDAEDCLFRREMTTNGKSRAFINDTPVALNVMKELGERLIDIHSQHQSLLLQKEDFQLNVVDIMAANDSELQAYRESYGQYRTAQKKYELFLIDFERNRENEEFLRFQYNELESAKLMEGEQDDLEQQSKTLSHTEEIKSSLFQASNLLTDDAMGVVDRLKETIDELEKIADLCPELHELIERTDSAYIEIKDIAQEVDSKMESINHDPQLLQTMNDRLDLIYSLERKFHVDNVEELIEKKNHFYDELQDIDGGTDRLDMLKDASGKALEKCRKAAKKLSDTRKKAAVRVEEELKTRLVPLGIPQVKFKIEFTEKELSSSGIDNISFLFNANEKTPLQPISQVASGGEIARIMLSLKAMISGAVNLPTIIFDEIDTGVSGRIAEKMADIMREMGQSNRQVISITHLPQIAALGGKHYKVSKENTSDGTVSNMRLLTEEDRVAELAQMLSGSDVTEAAIENARTLLDHGKRTK